MYLLPYLTGCVHWYNVAVLHAGVAELVDAPDSKSGGAKAPCRFEPDLRYQEIPAKPTKGQNRGKRPGENAGPLYSNYYTNALRKRVFHRFGGEVHSGATIIAQDEP
jgi:hypothetical protein